MFYERHIFVCENQRAPGERISCADKNAEILKYLKQNSKTAYKGNGKIRIQRAGCLDRCELGPVLVSYPEGRWFSLKSTDDAKRFLEKYIASDDLDSVKDLEISDLEI
jgi:(2Fe-2S) ferredoxin